MWSWFICRASWIQWGSQPLGVGGRKTYCDPVTIIPYHIPSLSLTFSPINNWRAFETETYLHALIFFCVGGHVSHLLLWFLLRDMMRKMVKQMRPGSGWMELCVPSWLWWDYFLSLLFYAMISLSFNSQFSYDSIDAIRLLSQSDLKA